MRRPFLAALAAVALAGCAGDDDEAATTTQATQATSPAPSTTLFEFQRGAPLGYRRGRLANRDYPIKIYDVSYASPRGGRVTGSLAVPPGEGPYPAVVYLHGSGGSRLDMLAPATYLAGRRAVTLSIDSPYARRPAPRVPRGIAGVRRQRDLDVQSVVDVRRAIDVLQSLPQVDDDRVGFVGFSAGGKIGAIAVGVEPRIRAAVLMSAGAPAIGPFVAAAPENVRAEVGRLLGDIDPRRYVGDSDAAILIQFGEQDEVVPQAELEALGEAARDATVLGYPGGHATITNARVIRDQLDFLDQELEIRGEPVPGALTDPPR
ncbi:MAG: acetylxylan esterase [Thermoleophilia bacterium]|nr:acetylxylan esterase [Thermoleophilia bacterium]